MWKSFVSSGEDSEEAVDQVMAKLDEQIAEMESRRQPSMILDGKMFSYSGTPCESCRRGVEGRECDGAEQYKDRYPLLCFLPFLYLV